MRALLAGSLALLLIGAAAPGAAQPAAAPASQRNALPDFAWRSLSAAQRRALQPLEREWGGLDAARRQKWLEIADRFPSLSPDEQARAQDRMTQWAQLSPEDRGKARMNFQQARQVSPSDRGSKWEAYQALPDDEKKQLVERAAATSRPAPSRPDAGRDAPREGDSKRAGRPDSASKSNLVPNPAFAKPPMPVGPTVTQAGPGATTSLMSRRAEPPPHQQTGLPKITATSDFVDQTTLQPKRGPQAAATRSVTASAPVPRP